MNRQILINGRWADTLSVTDRGLAYGQGVFETLRVERGQPIYWQQHMARLLEGCRRLGIPSQGLDAQLAADWSGYQFASGVLKLTVTRGAGGRGYAVTEPLIPTRILQTAALPQWPEQPAQTGIRVRWCTTRLAEQPLLAGIKHLNRLEQVLARAEWDDPAIREGLVCDYAGRVVEGTMSNLFWVHEGGLHTPDLSRCGVRGIVRDRLIELAEALGLRVSVGDYAPAELERAQELFVCNSLIGIWPVVQLGARAFSIGPITRRLQTALEENQGC